MGDRNGKEEILARLNPGSPDTELTPASTGDALTPATVAHAIALVEDRIGALILIVRVADMWSHFPELENRVLDEVLERAKAEKWRVHRPRKLTGVLRIMVRMALFEHCLPGRCQACRGRGQKFPKAGPVRTCERCQGSGRQPMTSERERAREVDIRVQSWRESWSERYSWIQRMLVERDSTAVRQLKRVMGPADR